MFSKRTNWQRQSNRLSELLGKLRESGKPVYDLTNSNPTDCGINYPQQEILRALSNPESLRYHPEPHGLISARKAVSEYYHQKSVVVDASDIFLTASTSEAYSLIFKLLCNADESILVPNPSYPLFDYLAQVNDVVIQQYLLHYDHGWYIDVDSIKRGITSTTKAIVLVNPHNPTGMFLKKSEYNAIQELALQKNLALIVDEVFADYAYQDDPDRIISTAGNSKVLTFTMNGISKMIGLPQMKLGWVVVSGEETVRRETIERFEILCDTFLSVNTPVQVALPELLRIGVAIQGKILERVRNNYALLRREIGQNTFCSLLESEGSWYGIIRMPRTRSDEEWALHLLETTGVYLFPCYFFDFSDDAHLVVSLLVEEKSFHNAIKLFTEVMISSATHLKNE